MRSNRRKVGVMGGVLILGAWLAAGGARALPWPGPPDGEAAGAWPWCGGVSPCPLDAGAGGLGVEAGPGWVRRYEVAGPFAARDVEAAGVVAFEASLREREAARVEADAAQPAAQGRRAARKAREKKGPAGFKWVPAADGVLSLGRAETAKQARDEVWIITAEVWSGSPRDVLLRVSVSGAARVFVGGAPWVAEGGAEALVRTTSMLPDDVELAGRLVAGWNRVVVAVGRRPDAEVAWRMRLRGADGAPLAGTLWRTGARGEPAAEGCGWFGPRLALEGVTAKAEGVKVGFRARASFEPGGIAPAAWPAAVVLRRRRDGAELARGRGWDLVAAGGVVEAALGAAEEVTLELDGTPCLSISPPHQADARLAVVVKARESVAAAPSLDVAARDSLLAVVDELAGLLGAAVSAGPKGTVSARVPRDRFEPLRAMLANRLESVAKGRDPFTAPGFHVRAYTSPIDGTRQRYVIAVPRSYNAARRLPLVVLSHGLHFHPEEMMLSALGERATPRTEQELQAGVSFARGQLWREGPVGPEGMLLVSHAGYGEAGPRPAGRLDVLHVVEDVQKHWAVEPGRVSITGFSLGGSVAFWAGLHHADVFAAAAPLCGYPNLEQYGNVRGVPKRPWEKLLLPLEGVSAHAPNGRQLPLWMVHGTRDMPSRSEMMAARYRELGYLARLDKPEEGHEIWDQAYADGEILRWLAGRRRNPRPAEVTLSAGRHRTAALDWLRIDRFAKWGEMGSLHGEVVALGRGARAAEEGTRLGATVRVRSEGVAGFSLRVGRLPVGVGRGDALEVDGQTLVIPGVERDVHLGRGADGRWEVRETPVAAAKRVGVEGPLWEVHLSPYVVIVGTADPRQTEANRLVAERVATPSPAVRLAPRVVTDVEWGERPLTGTGAILIGGPRSNRVTARLAAGIAARGLAFEADAVVVGGCRHAGDDVGVSAIVPNPEDAAFPLVVHAGVGAAGTLNARYLPEIVPDVVVHDRRIRAAVGDKLLGPREVRWAGFFDEDWALMQEAGACASTR